MRVYLIVVTLLSLFAGLAVAQTPSGGGQSAANSEKKPAATAAKDNAAKDKAAKDKAATEDEAPHTVWMRKKLDYTQEILAGIAVADYDRIATNASAMRALGRVEAFVRGRTPGYRNQMQIFEDATDELLRQAEKENVDGAALAFTQLTISCVNCHKQLRQAERK